MNTHNHPPAWKTVLAFAIIYLVWGSTFFAIWVGVREVPPFLLAVTALIIVLFETIHHQRARGEVGIR